MDVPTTEVDLGPEKIEDEKEAGPLLHCDLFDTEVAHKVAEMLLPGLATACVDSTTGGPFKTPGSVAVDLRKEMVDYLTQRSESFVAETVVLEGGLEAEKSDHPYDIISDFVDDFASSKRNILSRVSGWLLSDKREDNIDDFVQELEMNGIWPLDKRQALSETLVKNVDFKDSFHCNMKFSSSEELLNHVQNCSFSSVICQNEGCYISFCARHAEKHDSTCPFKIIPCEQKCSENVMRREMDRHCITVCPMKLVNCPFYAVGCKTAIPQCTIENHRSDKLHSHVLYTLQGIYKEAAEDDLKHRAEQILQASSNSQLAGARDVRSFTFIVKDLDGKLGPLEVSATKENSAEINAENKDIEESGIKEKGGEQNTETSNMENSSHKAEVKAIIDKDSTENDKNEDSRNSPVENKGSEESAHCVNMENLSAKAEVSTVEDSAEIDKKNKDTPDSNLEIKSNEDSAQTEMESSSDIAEVNATNNNEDSAQTDTESSSDKAEVNATNNGGTENNIKEIKSNEDSAQTDMESSSDKAEVKATNNGGTENNIKEIKSNEDGAQTDTESSLDKVEDSAQTDMGSSSDKAEVNATDKDNAENDIKNKETEESDNKDNKERMQTEKIAQ